MLENLEEFPGLENFDAYDENVVVLGGEKVVLDLQTEDPDGGITVVARWPWRGWGGLRAVILRAEAYRHGCCLGCSRARLELKPRSGRTLVSLACSKGRYEVPTY